MVRKLNSEQSFVFKETIADMLKNKEIVIDGNPNIELVRGISLKDSDRIFINLGAKQWKGIELSLLKVFLSQTIIHEHIHLLLKEYTGIGNSIMEERICQLMAGQIDLQE